MTTTESDPVIVDSTSPESKASGDASDGSKKTFLRRSVENAVQYKPQQLVVLDVISFVRNKNNRDKLSLLHFTEVLQKAGFGIDVVDMRDGITDHWVRADEASVSPNVTGDTKITALASSLMDNQNIYAGDDI